MKKPTVEQRRVEILEATCAAVIERGFAATRVADVARALDVSPSLIHYHFESKEQLLAEAFDHYARADMAELRAALAEEPDPLARLDRLLRTSVPEGSDDIEWKLWIDAWGEALRNPQMRAISQALDVEEQGVYEDVIREGVASGVFNAVDPRASAMRLTALVDGLAVQFAAHDDVLTRDELLHHLRVAASIEVGTSIAADAAADPEIHGARREQVTDGAAAPSSDTEAALRRLVERFCDATIRGDRELWASTWADDAEWSPHPGEAVIGRAAIVGRWEDTMKGFEWVVQTAPLMVFEIDEQSGSGSGRVVVNERYRRSDGSTGAMLGMYHDRYLYTDLGWRFAERSLRVIETG